MKLEYFLIKGFRRIRETKIVCGEATFLIGENNIGKSSVLAAMEIFFSSQSNLDPQDYFFCEEPFHQTDEIVLEAKFSDLPVEAQKWKGFKGRIFTEEINDIQTDCIYYRKTFSRNASLKREMKSRRKSLKDQYGNCKSFSQFMEAGISEELLLESLGNIADKNKNLSTRDKDKLELISELWSFDDENIEWATNPGGIDGNITIKLPRFLLIPAENKKDEIDSASGTLQKTMRELFEEVRDASENYVQAQKFLNQLAKELNPEEEESEFGKMLKDLNKIISDVFNQTAIHVSANLSDPGTAIKPTFEIEMSSNVKTKPERQGMGAIRSTVFALLRYREQYVERKRATGLDVRPLIIAFEEPEMYLHPNAAGLMREKIYELATSSNSKIICTTHSPYMIDLSRKIDSTEYPKQVLNLLRREKDAELNCDITVSTPFNTSQAFQDLNNDEKNFVKFILKIDDTIARVFFCQRVIIVEGDTEDLLIRETIKRLPDNKKRIFLSEYQIVKARGKSSIISLVRYLDALGIKPFVIHDKDTEPGAIKFNDPILNSLGNMEERRLMVEDTIEDILGYPEPLREKPYEAFRYITANWGDDWKSINTTWRETFEIKISPELFLT